MTSEKLKTKIQIKYANNGGAYTFSKVKGEADDDAINYLIDGILKIQAKTSKNVYKIVQTKISD